MQHIVQLVSDSGVFVPQTIFGANILFDRDSLTHTYGEKAELLNLSFARFPGGAITEDYFDLTDPDRTPPSRSPNPPSGLSEYLHWSAQTKSVPSIVLPTHRFLYEPNLVGEADAFLQSLALGVWGPIDHMVIEIGNEFYAPTELYMPISAASYLQVALELTELVLERLPEAQIAIQLGREDSDALIIAEGFAQAGLVAEVDLLVTHQYPFRGSGAEARFAAVTDLQSLWKELGSEAGLYLSEWNISATLDRSIEWQHDYGHAQLPAMIDILSEALLAGVEMAAIWGLQQNNQTRLTENEGNMQVLASGQLFSMMAEVLPGKQFQGAVLDTPEIKAFQASDPASNTTIMIISARDLQIPEARIDLDLPTEHGSGFVISSQWLELSGAQGVPLPRLKPDHWSLATKLDHIQYLDGKLIVDEVTDFDTIFLEIKEGGASTRLAGGKESELFVVSGPNVVVDAAAGDDVIYGSRWNDTLLGGPGSDLFIFAPHFGDDVVVGGDGDADLDVLDLRAVESGVRIFSQGGGSGRVEAGVSSIEFLGIEQLLLPSGVEFIHSISATSSIQAEGNAYDPQDVFAL